MPLFQESDYKKALREYEETKKRIHHTTASRIPSLFVSSIFRSIARLKWHGFTKNLFAP
jgi:hypothetical protein